MKKIKLFLASSLEGMEKDRKELGAFIDDLNDRYEPYGAYFHLIMADDDNESSLTDEAAESDLFYIVFHSDARDKALDEFNAAYENFKNNKKPRIMTYFKKMENTERDQRVLAFMERLDKELLHYYNNYAHIDTVKLNFVLQLKSLGLDKVKVELKDSELCLDDKPMMTLENIPIVFNNKQLAELKSEREEIEKELWELREKTRQNPDDDETLDALVNVKERKKQADEAIHNLQKAIIDMETSFLEKAGSGYITQRQKFARKCLEEGDVEGAKQALAADELKAEGARELELLDSRKKQLQALVSDWLQRARVLHIDWKNPNREYEVHEAYEQAIDIERKGGLERNTLLEYSEYLSDWGQKEKAVKYAKKYVNYLKSNQSEDPDYLSVYGHLARLYRCLQRYDEAEKKYRQKMDVLKQLAFEDPEKYVKDFMSSFTILQGFMHDRDRHDAVEELSIQKLDVLKQLTEEHPRNLDSASYLAEYYDAQALLIEDRANYDEAGKLIIPDESEPYRNDEAEKLYRQALDIWERLARENPIKYEKKLAASYGKLSDFAVDEEAEKLLTQAMDILERLAEKDSAKYERDLGRSYHNLARFMENRGRHDEAEKLYKQELNTFKRLEDENLEFLALDFSMRNNKNNPEFLKTVEELKSIEFPNDTEPF